MPAGDWEKARGKPWPYAGRAPVWPQDYPPTCNCNPPSHTIEQIHADGSFHSRTCPEHPAMQTDTQERCDAKDDRDRRCVLAKQHGGEHAVLHRWETSRS